jgi:hypothetical protein
LRVQEKGKDRSSSVEMAGNASIFPCPAPFLNELAFPATGGCK